MLSDILPTGFEIGVRNPFDRFLDAYDTFARASETKASKVAIAR